MPEMKREYKPIVETQELSLLDNILKNAKPVEKSLLDSILDKPIQERAIQSTPKVIKRVRLVHRVVCDICHLPECSCGHDEDLGEQDVVFF